MVLPLPHLPYLGVGFVSIPAEMQDTMKNNAVDLPPEGLCKLSCVLSYPVGADIYFPCQLPRCPADVKRDNVGKEIMLQVLAVYFQEVLIRTKHNVQGIQLFTLLPEDTRHKSFEPVPILQRDRPVSRKEMYRHNQILEIEIRYNAESILLQ